MVVVVHTKGQLQQRMQRRGPWRGRAGGLAGRGAFTSNAFYCFRAYIRWFERSPHRRNEWHELTSEHEAPCEYLLCIEFIFFFFSLFFSLLITIYVEYAVVVGVVDRGGKFEICSAKIGVRVFETVTSFFCDNNWLNLVEIHWAY